MKNIVFAGSSITWGQGLHYYSDLSDIKIGNDYFDRNELTEEHINFIVDNRFSKLVANHFNTIDIVRKENGGTTNLMLEFVNSIDLTNCDFIIFQFTDAFRDLGKFFYKGEERTINIRKLDEIYKSEFDKYIKENWNYNLDEYISFYISNQVKIIEQNIQKFENAGVKKCFVLNETNEFFDYFKKNDFFKERILYIKVEDEKYNTIEDALNNNKLQIIQNDNFIIQKFNKIIEDRHLTLTSHQVIANSIINKIENYIYEYEN